MNVRVKICGITHPREALAAARAGADAIGLVFHGPSPRAVSTAQAAEIVAALPAFVTTVGLFVDADADRIRHVLDCVPLDLLQMHGHENAALCRGFHRPYIKALHVGGGADVAAQARGYPDAAGILLDRYDKKHAGGGGRTFSWADVPAIAQPLILAGGLNSANVAQAVAQVRPWALDVSSGVEKVRGVKDADMIADFVRAARAATTPGR